MQFGAALSRIYLLRDCGDVDGLIEELGNPLERHRLTVRGAAAGALGRMGAVEAVPGLIALCADEDERVRMAALAALGRIGTPEALDGLAGGLQDQVYAVQAVALDSLGRAGDPRALRTALASLDHPSRRMRVVALGVIERDGDAGAVHAVTEAMGRERWFGRRRHRRTLERLSAKT